MGTALAHMLRDGAHAARIAGDRETGRPGFWFLDVVAWRGPDQAAGGPVAPGPPAAASGPSVRGHPAAVGASGPGLRAESPPAGQARQVARRLAAVGRPVSRRALRSGGIKGSDEALSGLARTLTAELAGVTTLQRGSDQGR